MMIILILPLLWNSAYSFLLPGDVLFFSDEFSGGPTAQDTYDLPLMDFFQNMLTNSLSPQIDRERDMLTNSSSPKIDRERDEPRPVLGSIAEMKKSLDNTIGLLKLIRKQLDDEPEDKKNLSSAMTTAFGQALSSTTNNPITYSREVGEVPPVDTVDITTSSPEPVKTQGLNETGNQSATRAPVNKAKKEPSPLMSILIKDSYYKKEYPYKKKNVQDKKKMVKKDSKASLRKKLEKLLLEESNED